MNIRVTGTLDVVGGGGMILSFSAAKYPPKTVNDEKKHRNKHSMRSSPFSFAYSVQHSSLTAKSDEMRNSSESLKTRNPTSPCSALTQENAVGIIGGVSVLSTLIFLEKLVWWSSRDGGESVPFIVCSDPLLKEEACKPSVVAAATTCNAPYSYNHEICMYSGVDETEVVDNLKRKRLFLEEGGARCIVMPCHLSHAWYGEVSQGCTLPFLHMAECVAMELKEARFRPLEAGSRVKIGVIAADATPVAGIYQEKLQNLGFEVVLPDKSAMDHIINPTIKSLNRKDKEGACNLLRIAIQILLVKAVNIVILASDDFHGLLPHDDPLSKKCINPMDSLVATAARWAKSAKLHSVNSKLS